MKTLLPSNTALLVHVEHTYHAGNFELIGQLTSFNVSQFRESLPDFSKEDYKTIVFEMSQLEFVDSIGIGILIFLHNQIKGLGKSLIFRNPSETLLEIFKITSLDQIFKID